ncbi:MAG: hypothetical protein QOE41_3069 [Mycobacterium sp.]|nr:hypothetical protein [Mycobacterium sp.]
MYRGYGSISTSVDHPIPGRLRAIAGIGKHYRRINDSRHSTVVAVEVGRNITSKWTACLLFRLASGDLATTNIRRSPWSFDVRQRTPLAATINFSPERSEELVTTAEDSEPHNDHDVVTKLSPWSVADTVARVLAVAAARELKVFAVIDHSGEAADVGMHLRDTTLVILGSPAVTARVISAAPLAALDLPLKVLVWADDCQTKLSYTAPRVLARQYGLSAELAALLAGIDALASAVIAR